MGIGNECHDDKADEFPALSLTELIIVITSPSLGLFICKMGYKTFSLAVHIFSLSLLPVSKLILEMFEPLNDYFVNQPMCPRKLENYFGIVH